MAPRKRRASELSRPAKRQSIRSSHVPSHESSSLVQHRSHGTVPGKVFVHGQGDCGQLGLGEDVTERKRPFPLDLDGKRAVQVAAGGMHSAALAVDGGIWTWGVNDEGALGRQTAGEIWEKAPDRRPGKDADPYLPGRVIMPRDAGRVLQLSAGDSHSMALTNSGAVYGWGTFRDSSGVFGFSPGSRIQLTPALVYSPASPDARVVRIASGADHVVALTAAGRVLTWGSGQQGQLGRIAARSSSRGDPKAQQLTPGPVVFKRQRGMHTTHMTEVAAGTYSSFALTADGRAEAWGLNNYGQLGLPPAAAAVFAPSLISLLLNEKVASVAGGQHHSLAVTEDGKLLAWGRGTYGGLGRASADVNSDEAQPTPAAVDGLGGARITAAAGGLGVSGALDQGGRLWLWGFGECYQLGRGGDSDAATPVQVPAAGRLQGHKIVQLELGGQHAIALAVEDPNAPSPPPTAAAAAMETEASAADVDDSELPGDSSGGGGGDGDGMTNVAAPAADPADLWAQAAANSGAAAAATAAPAPAADPAELWAQAVANSAQQSQAPPPASAADPADLWAQAVANSAQQEQQNHQQQQQPAVAASAPAAAPTHGAEAAVPEERSAAPDSVADGPSLAPGALGFAGAAAPEVTDRPFADEDTPAPAQ